MAMIIKLLHALILILLLVCGTPAFGSTLSINGDVAGTLTYYPVRDGDTLYDIARAHDLGIVEIMAANPGIDPWMPPVGKTLILPTSHVLPQTAHEGIVINLAELRLYYFIDSQTVMTFPIGIGREGWETPTGVTKVVRKKEGPDWIPPDSIRAEKPDLPAIVPAGPDNPMGSHALYLGWPGTVIHGTNNPWGIGRRSSHGCIRMYPEDIPVMFENVPIGTKVTIIDTPYKIGRYGDKLVLQAMPEQQQADEIMEHGTIVSYSGSGDLQSVVNALAAEGMQIDWQAVDRVAQSHHGLPFYVGSAD